MFGTLKDSFHCSTTLHKDTWQDTVAYIQSPAPSRIQLLTRITVQDAFNGQGTMFDSSWPQYKQSIKWSVQNKHCNTQESCCNWLLKPFQIQNAVLQSLIDGHAPSMTKTNYLFCDDWMIRHFPKRMFILFIQIKRATIIYSFTVSDSFLNCWPWADLSLSHELPLLTVNYVTLLDPEKSSVK